MRMPGECYGRADCFPIDCFPVDNFSVDEYDCPASMKGAASDKGKDPVKFGRAGHDPADARRRQYVACFG